MPVVGAVVQCPVYDSFRVQQVAGLFDVPLATKARAEFAVDVPDLGQDWQIGAIVGPSGSGKTTIAREAFGDAMYQAVPWPNNRAVIDGFPDETGIKQITATLTAVGFSSPPAWVRPYRTLSNGEQFRCELARALLSGRELVAFDEFTSVVDRTVAKIGSAAVAKALRAGRVGVKRFVAVTCHYDVLRWLAPDWVVDMATCQLARGCLQRPPIRLEIVHCRRAAWPLFAKHHYLSADLNPASVCYLVTWAGRPTAFVALVPMAGRSSFRRVSRVVVLPDFQGIGMGGAALDAVADMNRRQGKAVAITTSHPAMIRHLQRSAAWRATSVRKTGTAPTDGLGHRPKTSYGRAVVSFRYVGDTCRRRGPRERCRAHVLRGS